MTYLVQSIRRHSPSLALPEWSDVQRRLGAIAALALAVLLVPGSWHAVVESLSDAYLAVSIFVAGTLALVLTAERALKIDLGAWLQQYRRWQVPVAALLGAFPGCGGAILAITQYTRGHLSFGGVVATLTATMGDAMFLLLAREPQTAIGVLAASLVVAVISGYVVDAIHGENFMRPAKRQTHADNPKAIENAQQSQLGVMGRIWMALIVPGGLIGVLGAFQIEVDSWLQQWVHASPALWLGVIGAVLAVTMWIVRGGEQSESCAAQQPSVAHSVIQTTNFVTTWVVFAFVGYEVLVAATGVDLGQAFSVWGPLVPGIAVLVGFIPGCGPQILVTSMYLSGSLPLSAQLGNAMANDGDALFPAIATAPKAAMVATLYSAIPALIVAYGWYLIME